MMGLSPRLRGNRVGRFRLLFAKGSIPALTGKPLSILLLGRDQRVYPRAYGETVRHHHGGHHAGGLSPRLRGNRV